MRPNRHAVRTVKGVAHGVVVVIMRVQRSHYGDLAYGAQRLHLERSTGCTEEPLNQQCCIFADQEAAIAVRCHALGGVGNRCVETNTNFSHRCETLINQGRWRDASIYTDTFVERTKWDYFRKSGEGGKSRRLRDEAATREHIGLDGMHTHLLS